MPIGTEGYKSAGVDKTAFPERGSPGQQEKILLILLILSYWNIATKVRMKP